MKDERLRAEYLPRLRGDDGAKEQIQQVVDYLYRLREQLTYILNNLTGQNFNETALKELLGTFAEASKVEELAEEVRVLREQMAAMTAAAREAGE
jgi:hypothetical protein